MGKEPEFVNSVSFEGSLHQLKKVRTALTKAGMEWADVDGTTNRPRTIADQIDTIDQYLVTDYNRVPGNMAMYRERRKYHYKLPGEFNLGIQKALETKELVEHE